LVIENVMVGAHVTGASANRSLLPCAKVRKAPFAPRDFTMGLDAARVYRVVVNHQRREISTLFKGKCEARARGGNKWNGVLTRGMRCVLVG
jgi:hypothetical protein